jgi:hypothetical protein
MGADFPCQKRRACPDFLWVEVLQAAVNPVHDRVVRGLVQQRVDFAENCFYRGG